MIARVAQEIEDYEKSIQYGSEVAQYFEDTYGVGVTETVAANESLAKAYKGAGKFEEAEAVFKKVIQGYTFQKNYGKVFQL
mmetsp:Transcript_12440/g.10711  ORF Transcript_12440/g.10711 Transcript_12440/m.10711 type:complete len:81 (+) Transcript_12440:91-333(+)